MRETKKDQILRLHALKVPRATIARMAKCSPLYVSVTLWRAAHPSYGAKYMAKKRADPAYRARENYHRRVHAKHGSAMTEA